MGHPGTEKESPGGGGSLYQYVASRISPEIIRELENLGGHFDNTRSYLKDCRSKRLVTKPQAKILEEAFVSKRYMDVETGSRRRGDSEAPKAAAPAQQPAVPEEAGGLRMTRHSRDSQGNSSD